MQLRKMFLLLARKGIIGDYTRNLCQSLMDFPFKAFQQHSLQHQALSHFEEIMNIKFRCRWILDYTQVCNTLSYTLVHVLLITLFEEKTYAMWILHPSQSLEIGQSIYCCYGGEAYKCKANPSKSQNLMTYYITLKCIEQRKTQLDKMKNATFMLMWSLRDGNKRDTDIDKKQHKLQAGFTLPHIPFA